MHRSHSIAKTFTGHILQNINYPNCKIGLQFYAKEEHIFWVVRLRTRIAWMWWGLFILTKVEKNIKVEQHLGIFATEFERNFLSRR
jgi:hypothetical protein